ncbi:MAG: DEAD/DEAH box helicase [Microbacterium sp.]|uniref:DEAD/DEAH box helicase n=1 Tax=Microbacterium sp. TaxID=51671 RepID=UPI003F7D9F83
MGLLDDGTRQRLWGHQKRAVAAVEEFLERPDTGGRSFIVSMPTGSGKSGVIGFLAQDRLGEESDVLLLCPWDALASQLSEDVSARFWRHAGIDSSTMTKTVRLMPSTAAAKLADATAPTIWVMTLAALNALDRPVRDALSSRVKLVIVDEGHYEPAPSWANAVRNLARPTALFTATPFRNDVKYFDVEPGDSFHYPASEAISSSQLRSPRFASVATESPTTFVEQLREFVAGNLTSDDKIIVRCATQTQIRDVVGILRRDGETAVGIHERFKSSDRASSLLKKVPANHEARYWVHQNKLLEGIDHSEFRRVALLARPSGDRALIQQIGRVLRGAAHHPTAWVVGGAHDRLQETWDAFLAYDFQNDASVSPIKEILGLTVGRHFYTSGTFRAPLDIEELDVDEVRVPRSFTIHERPTQFDDPIGRLLSELDRAIEDADAEGVGPAKRGTWDRPGQPRVEWALRLMYVNEQSPILARSSFYDSKLELAFFAVADARVYVHSGIGLDLESIGLRRLPTAALRAAFARSTGTYTSVTLKNTDLSGTAERTRAQSAASLIALAPDLSDFFKSPSTITGVVRSDDLRGTAYDSARYVGFARSRVREQGRTSVDELLNWIAQIERGLVEHGRSLAPAIFARYADVIDLTEPVVQNFLLDLDETVLSEYIDAEGHPLLLTDRCVDVAADSTFPLLRTDGTAYDCSLVWSGRRYEFHSDQLDLAFNRPADRYATFSTEVTERQAFRLIVHEQATPDDLVQYVDAQFVRPRSTLALKSSSSGVLLDSLLRAVDLSDVTSEKGTTTREPRWSEGSMFRRICDDVASGELLGEPVAPGSILVCDDDAGETADFYVVDRTNRKLFVVHAKVSAGNGGHGASGLHDVVAQAQKHLGTIRPGGSGLDRPRLRSRWGRKWKLLDSSIPRIQSEHTASEASNAVWDALRDPSYQRVVVIATAGILSKRNFLTKARQNNANALQALYLIQSAWASAGAIGSRLLIVANE